MLKIASYTFNPFQENTYVLSNEKGNAIIIDPGMYFTAERERFEQDILRRGLRIDKIVNTHCHIDHIFSVQWVAQKYQAALHIPIGEQTVLDKGKEMAAQFGLDYDPYTGIVHHFEEGDIITLGEDVIKVIAAPGHSPGGVCLYAENEQWLIAGDVLFKESIGRTDLPGGNHQQLIDNIREKIFVLPDDVIVYPGHGTTTTIGHEKINNPFVQV